MTIHQILTKYWGYSTFRDLQEDIINSVLEGHDTLALLPTGGGKSICFQVPALAMDGVCIVVTPLIALMKDQVDNLHKKGIKAVAVYSGMKKEVIDRELDNCVYGDTKFLYVSPERLKTNLFRERLKRMKVGLLAVDEAHCISQWGYDFRPPYLQIAEIREFIPTVPIIALTATATPEVVIDIQERLNFRKYNALKKSFERKNLTYFVFQEEDKFNRMLTIFRKVRGTGIVYVRNRRKTKEIAEFLKANDISADYYHAGLDPMVRERKQEDWIQDRTRIMACTNAFGMGIDKPDVRVVVHTEPPDNLEAYFQEAGRAGRDLKTSYAVLLFNQADMNELEKRFILSYPEIEYVREIYDRLGSFLSIPLESGEESFYDFDITTFSEYCKHNPVKVFNALKLLERNGFILMTEALHQPSRLMFRIDKDVLYRYQVKNPHIDPLIKTLLRSYPGLFSVFVNVNEAEIARRLNTDIPKVEKGLKILHENEIITYVQQTDKPQIIYLSNRVDSKSLIINQKEYKLLKENAQRRLESVKHYLSTKARCRSQILLDYFGQSDSRRCGKCDVCLQRNTVNLSDLEFDSILELIKPLLQQNSFTHRELVEKVGNRNSEKTLNVIRFLLDNGKIVLENGKLKWNEKK